MTRGPLPASRSRRRNAPTIPTTELPVSGRKGRPPEPPAAYLLGKAGKAWWKWAWGTPQAVAWDSGALYAIARRAQLEDDLELISRAVSVNELAELLDLRDEDEVVQRLEFIVGELVGMAAPRLAVMKEMRELDKKLGLDPKGLADLRWKIVSDEKYQEAKEKAAGTAKPPKPSPSRGAASGGRGRGKGNLRVVDPALAESG